MAAVPPPPRAPVLASREVASHYVEYARWDARGWLWFFGALLIGFAVIAGPVSSEWGTALLLGLVGLALIVVGVWLHLYRRAGF